MQRSCDVEARAHALRPLHGFPSLAEFIASDRDHTSLVFRRFDKLAARNLLYLQSELAVLETEQEAFDAQDSDILNDLETKECAMNWEKFKAEAENQGNERQRKRMELTLKIRKKLKEYSMSLSLPHWIGCSLTDGREGFIV